MDIIAKLSLSTDQNTLELPVVYKGSVPRYVTGIKYDVESPKFKKKFQPFITELIKAHIIDSSESSKLNCVPRFVSGSINTAYLVHYGSSASDSTGCVLVPFLSTPVTRKVRLFLNARGFPDSWNLKAFITNLAILEKLGITIRGL